MNKEIATVGNQTHALAMNTIVFEPEQVELIKRTICKGATDDELALFMGQCQRTGLDPFSKQIHAVKRWDSKEKREVMSIQVGIDGFRLVADRHRDDHGERDYAGQVGPFWCGEDGIWRDVWIPETPPSAAKVGILRKGFAEPLFSPALYRSYVQTTKEGVPTRFWAQMPDVMLAKVAEALALRKAFPNDLSGLYTSDEMGQADNTAQLDPRKQVPIQQASQASTEFVTFENATKLMEKAATVGLSVDEALEIAGAPSIKLIPREKGLAIAMEITRRRNEIAKAATQKDAAPATPDAAAGAVDAESELFGDGEGAQ